MISYKFIEISNIDSIRAIESMAKQIWREYYPFLCSKEQIDYMLEMFQSEKAIISQIKQGYRYYLIRHKEAPAGYISFKINADNVFLSKLYLKSNLRGIGLGKKMLEFVEKTSLENKISIINLHVNKKNLNSLKLYEKAGFKIKKSLVTDIGNGFVMDDYLMEKELI